MPAYGSQTTTNSPLQSAGPGDVNEVLAFNAETPGSGTASIAVPLATRPFSNAPVGVSVQLECPSGIGAGVFQIQDADNDVAGDYASMNFGGSSPGQITSTTVNASGTGRAELLVTGRFLRILCVTAPGNPVTVRVRQK